MPKTTWKIGELASQSGITVRTLHHYHQIGLLVPSEFTEAGHRLYTEFDVSKLQQILVLKQLGLSLDVIYNFIGNTDSNHCGIRFKAESMSPLTVCHPKKTITLSNPLIPQGFHSR